MCDDLESLVEWYIQCKETLQKVESLYSQYIPTIRYNSSSYQELRMNYNNAYQELKKKIKYK